MPSSAMQSLAAGRVSPPRDLVAGYFVVGYNSYSAISDKSQLGVLPFKAEEVADDMGGEPFELENRMGLGALDPNDLQMPACEEAVPTVATVLRNDRAAGLRALGPNGFVSARVLFVESTAVQVSIDAAVGAKAGDGDPIALVTKAGGADAAGVAGHEHGSRGSGDLSALVGIVAASSAITAVACSAVSPAVAFGFFLVLLAGLSLSMASARGE